MSARQFAAGSQQTAAAALGIAARAEQMDDAITRFRVQQTSTEPVDANALSEWPAPRPLRIAEPRTAS